MLKTVLLFVVSVAAATSLHAETAAPGQFTFKDASGKSTSVDVVDTYQAKKISSAAIAKLDPKIDPKMVRAASIAQERAHAHSQSMCWHYVKEALVAAGVVNSRPKTEFAKQAAQELVQNYGFKKLPVRDPYQAPLGSVLVYNNAKGAGHIELRTKDGFVSDFRSKTPSRRPLIGVYAKA